MAITPGGRVGDSTPLGKKPGPRQLTDYTREIAHALMRKYGWDESHAIAVARNAQKKWRRGGGKVRPQVRAGATKSLGEQAVLDHVKSLAVSANERDIALAAQSGHHIAGTAYHWHHGWKPRDRFTAQRYHKPFNKSDKFHNVEPEEFNGHGGTPFHIAEGKGNPGKFEDSKPEMKYAGNKHLGGAQFKDKNGNLVKVAKVSQSKSHVLDESGKKHKIANLKPASQRDATKLALFQKQKYSGAVKAYQIKSTFSAPKKEHNVPLGPKPISKTKQGNYVAAPDHFDEPTFPQTTPRTELNMTGMLSPKEKDALKHYTGSGYHDINSSLRNGKPGGSYTPHLDTALSKATTLNEPNLVLHRGLDVRAIHDLQAGDSFVDKGFVSTSRNHKLGLSSRSTRLHITSMHPDLKAMDVKPISTMSHENEVLLQRNSKFTVQQRVQHGNHVHLYVHAEPA